MNGLTVSVAKRGAPGAPKSHCNPKLKQAINGSEGEADSGVAAAIDIRS